MRFARAGFAGRSRRSHRTRGSHRRHAFTIVEVLVVVGIIVILLSLLLPSLRRVREGAKQLTCLSNLRQIGLAFVGYTHDNSGHFPTCGPRAPFPQASSDWIFWEETGPRKRDLDKSAIAPYLDRPLNPNLLRCPSDDLEVHQKYFDPPYRYSYVFNLLIHNVYDWPDLGVGQIRNPSAKIMIIEEDEHGIGDGSWWPLGGTVDWLAIRHDHQRIPETFSTDINPLVGQGVINVENPANVDRRGNVVYCDGHAEYTTRRVVEDPMHYDPLR